MVTAKQSLFNPDRATYQRVGPDAEIDVYAEDSAIGPYALGTKYLLDERTFRYTLNGATALSTSRLLQMQVPVAGHIDEALDTPAIDATIVSFTNTSDAVDVDEYAEGFFWINDDTGEGHIHRVKSNVAAASGVAGNVILYDPIVVTLGAGATGSLFNSPFRKVIIHPSPATAMLVGVNPLAITADYYFWMQVGGPAAVLTQGTIVINEKVIDSATVDGAVAPTASTAAGEEHYVGVVVVVNANGEHSAIWLALPTAV